MLLKNYTLHLFSISLLQSGPVADVTDVVFNVVVIVFVVDDVAVVVNINVNIIIIIDDVTYGLPLVAVVLEVNILKPP